MRSFFRNHDRFLPTAILFLTACLVLSIVVPHGDEILFFNHLRREPLNSILLFWTKLGEEICWIFATIALALFVSWRSSLLILLAGLTVLSTSFLLKEIWREDRPARFFENQNRLDEVVFVPGAEIFKGQTSFPSGHSMSAFAFWGLISMTFRRRKWVGPICATVACGVGLSRIFLCNHFLQDVAAGGFVGLAIFFYFSKLDLMPRFLAGPKFQRSLFVKN